MRILALSDISWQHTSLGAVQDRIGRSAPALVLIAGDLVNDRTASGWRSAAQLIDWLEAQRIQTFFIQGNWDEQPEYEALVQTTRTMAHVAEISGQIAHALGAGEDGKDDLRVLGLSFSYTTRLTHMRRLSELWPEPVDIVLTHAPLGRRIWLFQLNTELIVTGHYDSQLAPVGNQLLLSFDTYPENYALLDRTSSGYEITYYQDNTGSTGHGRVIAGRKVSRARWTGDELVWETSPVPSITGAKGLDYPRAVSELIEARQQLAAAPDRRPEIVPRLLARGLSRTQIQEYLGPISHAGR